MATNRSDNIVTPVGRIIMGSLYNPRTTNREGQPLMYKSGAKAGQPRADFFFALAIRKGAEVQQAYGALNWAATPWGAEIYKAGCAFLAHAASMPSFAWKVADGDSTAVNSAGNRMSDNEHARGHWVLFFNGTIAPRLCNADGSAMLTEPDAILPGYFVQVGFNCKGNDSTQKPGVYLNPVAVARVAFGEVIQSGVNVASLGFGVGVQLPPGASVTPLATLSAVQMPGMQPPPLSVPGGVGMPGAAPVAAMPPAMAMTQPAPVSIPPAGPSLAPVVQAIQPNAQFLQVPPPGALALPVAPAYGQHKMTALAQGTYEQYRQAGHSDAAMIAAGVMSA